jgi:hypothetical protein
VSHSKVLAELRVAYVQIIRKVFSASATKHFQPRGDMEHKGTASLTEVDVVAANIAGGAEVPPQICSTVSII